MHDVQYLRNLITILQNKAETTEQIAEIKASQNRYVCRKLKYCDVFTFKFTHSYINDLYEKIIMA